MESTDGYGKEDDWTVNCPHCDYEFHYKGFFDKDDVTKCKCGTHFKTRRVWIDDNTYI